SESSSFIGGNPDLRWLVRLRGAEHWFSRLAVGKSPAGRLYGVCGLYVVDSQAYSAALENLAHDESDVTQRFGFSITTQQLRASVGNIPHLCASFRIDGSAE